MTRIASDSVGTLKKAGVVHVYMIGSKAEKGKIMFSLLNSLSEKRKRDDILCPSWDGQGKNK